MTHTDTHHDLNEHTSTATAPMLIAWLDWRSHSLQILSQEAERTLVLSWGNVWRRKRKWRRRRKRKWWWKVTNSLGHSLFLPPFSLSL